MKPTRTYIRTLDRLKVSNLAGRLIGMIDRILPPDTDAFHEAILRAGAPGAGQPLRYLPFNRQIHQEGDVLTSLSLVVLLNNPTMERFLLKGLHEKISRLVFRFSFNPMHRFIRSIRLDWKLLQIMATASGEFIIMGIVQREEVRRKRLGRQRCRFIYPLLLIPTGDKARQEYIRRFEKRHTIQRIKLPLLPLYRNGSHLLEK